MTLIFRLLLFMGALATSLFFLIKIRRAQVQIEDTVFWFLFSIGVLLISIFPGILTFFARLLGVQSPVNFLYLVVIFLLLVRLFKLTLKVSMLESKLTRFAQQYAIQNRDRDAEVEKERSARADANGNEKGNH